MYLLLLLFVGSLYIYIFLYYILYFFFLFCSNSISFSLNFISCSFSSCVDSSTQYSNNSILDTVLCCESDFSCVQERERERERQ